MNINQLVHKYAASPSNPPKGYGSIDAGLKVAAYRSKRLRLHQSKGLDYVEAVTIANKEAIEKFGEPF